MTDREQLTREFLEALDAAMGPLMEREEAAGTDYRTVCVSLLDALEARVGRTIAAVSDHDVRERLTQTFRANLTKRVSWLSSAIAGTIQ